MIIVIGIKNSINALETVRISITLKANVIECPMVKAVTSHINFFQDEMEARMEKEITNRI